MRIRILKLNPEILIDLLRGKTSAVAPNLPADAELLELKYDLFSNQVQAVVRSSSFEDVVSSQPTPEFALTYASIGKNAPEPLTTVAKILPKPVTITQPQIEKAKNPLPQSSGYTGRVEEEFSPDQRKLLSFKLEGDCVIVKPTHFLKGEWDDINDIVRSLGGKWVKGDIISYWVVPLQ